MILWLGIRCCDSFLGREVTGAGSCAGVLAHVVRAVFA